MGNCCSGPSTMSSPALTGQSLYQQETTQSTPLTPIPSSTVPNPAVSVALSSKDGYGTPVHDTASHDDEMISTRTRVPSHDSASSHLPLNSGYSSSPFEGDKFASQHPLGAESRLHQYRSRGSGSPQLNESMSVDTRFLQGARSESHSYSRMNRTRTASASLLDYGHPPTSTQFGPRPALGAGHMPAERHERLPRFPSTLRSRLSDDFRYAPRRCPISHYYSTIVHRFNLLVVGKVRFILLRQDLDATDACFIAARVWQVLTHRCRFQGGHVGMYLIMHSYLTNLRLAKLEGDTNECIPENC